MTWTNCRDYWNGYFSLSSAAIGYLSSSLLFPKTISLPFAISYNVQRIDKMSIHSNNSHVMIAITKESAWKKRTHSLGNYYPQERASLNKRSIRSESLKIKWGNLKNYNWPKKLISMALNAGSLPMKKLILSSKKKIKRFSSCRDNWQSCRSHTAFSAATLKLKGRRWRDV